MDSTGVFVEKRCDARDRLFADYRQALQEWVASIKRLDDETNVHNQRLFDRVEEFRFRTLLARDQYANHIANHRCGIFKTLSRREQRGRSSG
jgi:hypothetical protein